MCENGDKMGDNVTNYSGSFSIKLWNCQKKRTKSRQACVWHWDLAYFIDSS
nr:MAG TPA: hypothetical protein [Caudoviricetes sp.]